MRTRNVGRQAEWLDILHQAEVGSELSNLKKHRNQGRSRDELAGHP
jgi:hypothetical protein